MSPDTAPETIATLRNRLMTSTNEPAGIRLAYALDLLERLNFDIAGLTKIRDEVIPLAHDLGGGDHRIARAAGVSNGKVRRLYGADGS